MPPVSSRPSCSPCPEPLATAEHLIKVGQDQGIAPVVELLRSAEETVQQGAAAALWSLSVTTENKIKIVERGGLPLLIRMLRSADEGSQEQVRA